MSEPATFDYGRAGSKTKGTQMVLETQGLRALIGATSIVFISCMSACHEDATWRIDVQGFVSSSETGEPVPDAHVRLEVLGYLTSWRDSQLIDVRLLRGLNSTTTNPAGEYRMKYQQRQGCPADVSEPFMDHSLDLVVEASGYQRYSHFSASWGNDLPPIRCEPERQRIDIKLEPLR